MESGKLYAYALSSVQSTKINDSLKPIFLTDLLDRVKKGVSLIIGNFV